jgi:biopolymer transport protein ExbB/TolQ
VEGLQKFFSHVEFTDWVILTLGGVALVIVSERFRLLFLKIKMTGEEFVLKVEALLLSNKIEEAIAFSGSYRQEPLAQVIKAVLERSDRDDQAIHQAHELKLGEFLSPLGKRINYLLLIANVSTLIGLLGTVSGLIMSFEAVSFADPTQKQALLSQGISLAMRSTALGLSVAIPVMICHSILNSRQNNLADGIVNHSGRVVDLLTNRQYLDQQKKTC